jgi:signal transduction histidine kinase
VAVALYSAGEHGRTRWAIGTALVLLGVSTAVRMREGDDLAVLLGYELASQSALMLAVVALGDAVRSRRRWRAELRRQAAAAELEREREAAARVQQERLRIARDLHDVLAHTLSVVTLHGNLADEALADDPPDVPAARGAVTAVREAAGGATRELLATVGLLRTPDDEGPVPGLDQLDHLVSASAAAGLTVRLEGTCGLTDVPAVVSTTAYRIVQESLTNVLRHADADAVTVQLDQGQAELRVRITDDGRRGRPVDPVSPVSPGYGLAGMRERAALLGGRLDAGPAERGWVVEVVLPVRGKS